jgi:hypothetical protein
MQRKFIGWSMVLGGLGLIIGSVIVWVLWLGFCFGTVIVGIAMLFLAPALLIAPLVIGGGAGITMLGAGMKLASS